MLNPLDGYIKIGKSYSSPPHYRERTLQSQEPQIKLLGYVAFPTASQSHYVELALHQDFKKYRVRGEWFKLPQEQKKELFSYMTAHGATLPPVSQWGGNPWAYEEVQELFQ